MIRRRIRQLLKQRLLDESRKEPRKIIESLRQGPIAVAVEAANEQHYEVPASFFKKVLGPQMKYSCAFYDSERTRLPEAEEKMLRLSSERAEIKNGMSILELGCGWGSMTLWMAKEFPQSQILGVSNSHSQRAYILDEAEKRGLRNIRVMTADMNHVELKEKFDRIVSIEMFEHMRNIEKLLEKISGWMKSDAKLFVHVFCHKKLSYFFDWQDDTDWMSRYFFMGGMMPSYDLYKNFDCHLRIQRQWFVSGTHYGRTARDWLKNMDRQFTDLYPSFEDIYGTSLAGLWWERWRIFFMSCEELWNYDDGSEWHVAHYLMEKP